MAKYYLQLRIEPDYLVSLRVYRDDPRDGFGGSIEAFKMRNAGELQPAKVRINADFSYNRQGYTPDEVDRVMEWFGIAREVAKGFDLLIKSAADFERVMIEPCYENVISLIEYEGRITISFPDSWETL